jgi:hypothetical protein
MPINATKKNSRSAGRIDFILLGVVSALVPAVIFCALFFTRQANPQNPAEQTADIPEEEFVPFSERSWTFYPDSEQRYGIRYPSGLAIHPFVSDEDIDIEGDTDRLKQVGGVSFAGCDGGPGVMGVKVYDDPEVRTLEDWVEYRNNRGKGRVYLEKKIDISGYEAWVTYTISGEGQYEESFPEEKKTIIEKEGKIFEIWTRFYGDPSAHEWAWKYFRFLAVSEYNPAFDKEQEEYSRLIEEKTIHPIIYCADRIHDCDVEPEDLNVVVHVPAKMYLRESFQSPFDTGLSRFFQFYKEGSIPIDVSMYATSHDYAVGIGEGIPPYSGAALDLSEDLVKILDSFPRANIRDMVTFDMDGRTALFFYWMGDSYGCERVFEAMLVVPNPNHAYSNFVFEKTLDRTSCEFPEFGAGDMGALIDEHFIETQEWIAYIDEHFDIE